MRKCLTAVLDTPIVGSLKHVLELAMTMATGSSQSSSSEIELKVLIRCIVKKGIKSVSVDRASVRVRPKMGNCAAL